MNDSTVVFLRNGVVSLIIGLSVLSIPLLLRDGMPEEDETSQKMAKLSTTPSQNVKTDGSDIIKELETAFPSRKTIRPKSVYTPAAEDYIEPEISAYAPPQPESNVAIPQFVNEAAPTRSPQRANRTESAYAPSELRDNTYALPEPDNGIAAPQLAKKAALAPADSEVGIETRARQEPPASEELSGRARKTVLDDKYTAKPLLPPTNVALVARQPQTLLRPLGSPSPDVAPALPERHPRRQARYEATPVVNALQVTPAPVKQEPKPRWASGGNTLSAFVGLFRTSEPSRQPVAPAAVTRPPVKPTPAYSTPRAEWEPASCD